jgi:hypothetical protein
MNDLAATAQRLRDVKQATRNFLTLWALEQVRERVRRGQQEMEDIDTTAIEAAIKDLDVYGSESVIRGVLTDTADATEGTQ